MKSTRSSTVQPVSLPLTTAIVALLAMGVSLLVSFWMLRGHDSNGISRKDRQNLLQQMMGVKNEDQLPLKNTVTKVPLQSKLIDGVNAYDLTAEAFRWRYADGKEILAWGYNGQTPGPEIRVTEGDKVRLVLKNNLPKATSLHFHGINLPNSQDGIPGLTQKAIEPGQSFVYEFTATPAGTHFYHTHGSGHSDEAQQLDMGLYGAFVVEPLGFVKPNKDYTLVLGSWQTMSGMMNGSMAGGMNMMSSGTNNNMMSGMTGGNTNNMMGGGMNHMMNYNLFTINGAAYPSTSGLEVKTGDRVRLRFINPGSMPIHPMHLHGHQFKVVALDGNELTPAQQYYRNTLPIGPGESIDVEFVADNPGVWLLHCHELHHAAGGMITTIKYEGVTAPVNDSIGARNNLSDSMNHMMH